MDAGPWVQALLPLSGLGLAGDPRAADALDHVAARELPHGRWQADGTWWRGVGLSSQAEAVDRGRRGPSVMVILNALRVLRAAGRLAVSGV